MCFVYHGNKGVILKSIEQLMCFVHHGNKGVILKSIEQLMCFVTRVLTRAHDGK